VGSGSRSNRASCAGPSRAGPSWRGPSGVLTPSFQQRPLTFRGGTLTPPPSRPEPQSGQEQEPAGSDEHRLDGERGAQPELVGQAAEEVGGDDDEDAAEELDAGVGGVAVAGSGVQGQGQREGVQVGDAEPAQEQPGDGRGGRGSQPEKYEPGGGSRQRGPQQRDGPSGAAGEPHAADPARQDAEVEDAHRGRGLGGPQPGAGEQFGAEVDRAKLDRNADGGHRGQQPAGQRQPAAGGPTGRPGGQRLAPVAQVQAGQGEGGQGQHRPPARRGALEQAEQQRGEHRAAGRADVGFGQRAVAARADHSAEYTPSTV